MIKKLTIRSWVSGILWFLFLAAMGAVMFWYTDFSVLECVKGPTALTADSDLEELEGEYVSLEVKYPLASYLETTKTTKVNGASTGTKRDRVSYVVVDEELEMFLGVDVSVKKEDAMEELADLFWNSFDSEAEIPEPEGLTVKGTLIRLTGEDLGYYGEFMDYMEIPYDEPVYQIMDGQINGESMTNILGMSVLGLILLLFALVILVKTFRHSANRQVKAYLQKNPDIRMEDMEQDFAQAEQIGSFWIGRRWTFGHKLTDAFLENQSVIWVHSCTESNRKTTTTYLLWEFLDGTYEKVSMSEKRCKEMMEFYSRFPHIVVGNSPDYAYLLKNNKEEFLNLKYRKYMEQ